MDYTLLVKLLCAHVIVDFMLQGKKVCAYKKELGTWKGWGAQVLHSLLQAAMAYVIVWDWSNWIIPAAIFGSHLVIDVVKSWLGDEDNVWHFIFDQLAHVAVIICLFMGLEGWVMLEMKAAYWVVLVAYLLVTVPASIFVSKFYKQWELRNAQPKKGKDDGSKSLPRGGEYIGMLERVLILTFVLAGCPEGIGFLLAAKSVFRFGDLQKASEVQQTEYVLIGTFLSFAIAILVGYCALKTIKSI